MKRRLKVLVLSPEPPYPPTHGGARLKLFHVLKHLSQWHDLTLLTFLESPDEREYIPVLEKFCRKVIALDRKPLTTAPTWRERWQAPLYKMAYTEEMAHAIERELRENKFDLVHVDLAHMAVYTPQLRGHRKLLAVHDSQTLSYTSKLTVTKTWKQKLRGRWLLSRIRSFERKVYPEYDSCVVVAEEDQQTINRLCPTLHVDIVPNGVDLNYFRPTPPELEDANQLIFTGTMSFGPNVDAAQWFVNEILPRIHKSRPEVRFQIVGRNPAPEVAALAKMRNVSVTGFVPDFRPLAAKAAIFVCPLRIGSGMKCKMQEAMAMGKAIVTTPEGTSGMAGRDGVEYVVTEEVNKFAAAVLALLQDNGQRRRLGSAARAFVEKNYSWEHTGELVHKAYLQAVGA